MPVSAKAALAHRAPPKGISAKITSKGQITIPAAIRKSLGVKPGDHLRFEPQKNGFRVVRHNKESVFEQFRGIGNPGIGSGREAVMAYMREIRGHDDYDDLLAGQ
jgi:AbrB family looped-hinge helix DNA binding protein